LLRSGGHSVSTLKKAAMVNPKNNQSARKLTTANGKNINKSTLIDGQV